MSMLKMTDTLIGHVTGGAVIGLDGGIWATTPGFYGNTIEFGALAAAFAPKSDAPYRGVEFQGERYVITSLTDDVIVAQKSSHGLVAAKCNKCIVIGFHDDQMSANKCYEAVTRLAATLRERSIDDLI